MQLASMILIQKYKPFTGCIIFLLFVAVLHPFQEQAIMFIYSSLVLHNNVEHRRATKVAASIVHDAQIKEHAQKGLHVITPTV